MGKLQQIGGVCVSSKVCLSDFGGCCDGTGLLGGWLTPVISYWVVFFFCFFFHVKI